MIWIPKGRESLLRSLACISNFYWPFETQGLFFLRFLISYFLNFADVKVFRHRLRCVHLRFLLFFIFRLASPLASVSLFRAVHPLFCMALSSGSCGPQSLWSSAIQPRCMNSVLNRLNEGIPDRLLRRSACAHSRDKKLS